MTCATATFPEVNAFEAGVLTLRDCRRVLGGIVIGLGGVVAIGALAALAMIAAAWIVSTSLSSNHFVHARASIEPDILSLPSGSPALPVATDVAGPAPVLSDRDPVPDAAMQAEVAASATALLAPVATASLLAEHPPELTPEVPTSPQPSAAPRIQAPSEPTNPPAPPASSLSAGLSAVPAPSAEPASTASLPPPRVPEPPRRVPAASQTAALSPPAAPPTSQKSTPPEQAPNRPMSLPSRDSRTAIYDIAAHTVYLPGGERLEAHSGLGRRLDDPHYASEKNRGPTPPNIYDLTLRGQLFHGVRAIRLNPIDEAKMFGRDGMLAHTYMLGPSGQSFGCVSFKDYPAFLRAFLKGEFDRLIVVPHLGSTIAGSGPPRRRSVDRYALDR